MITWEPSPQIMIFVINSRGLQDMPHKNGIFFRDNLNFKRKNSKDPEDRFDPQPDPSIQPKARGLLHMEREYIANHI